MTSGFLGIPVQEPCRLLTELNGKKCSYASGRITPGQVTRFTVLHCLLPCPAGLSLRCLSALSTAGEVNTKRQSNNKSSIFQGQRKELFQQQQFTVPAGIQHLGLVMEHIFRACPTYPNIDFHNRILCLGMALMHKGCAMLTVKQEEFCSPYTPDMG